MGRFRTACDLAKGPRARRFLWALLGQGGPTALQLVHVVVIARLLGAEATGNFFLIVAIAVIGSSFVGLGAGGLVLREVSRDPGRAGIVFGQAQALSLVSFPLLLPLVSAIAALVVDQAVALWIILAIAASDLLAARLLTTSWSLFIAREEQVRASLLICLMPLARVSLGAMIAFWPPEERLGVFALLYFCASFGVALVAMVIVRRVIGPAPLSLRGYEGLSGFSFSMTWLNVALQGESDKVMLGLFGSPALVALYAVAARLMDGAAMPPRALREVLQARMFRAGAAGSAEALRLTCRLIPAIVIYGLAIWLGFWLLAPVIAPLFGPGFEGLAAILPILGALPLLRALSEFGAEIFMASDRPAVQAVTQSLMTLLRLTLGAILISAWSLNGAIATALGVTLLSGVILWALALRRP